MMRRSKFALFVISALFVAGTISPSLGYGGPGPGGADGSGGSGGSDGGGGKSIFAGTPTAEDCQACHTGTVVLHHDLLNTVVPPLDESVAPDAPNAVPGEVYECLSCHDFANPDDFRDCMTCHPIGMVTGSPGRNGSNIHHDGSTDCGVCHN